jgi:hypothetical protein
MTGYKAIAASKCAQREKAIEFAHPYVLQTHSMFLNATGLSKAFTCSLFCRIDFFFLSYSASEIVNNIENGQWTASQVVDAYIARAAFAHQRTNCLTEGNLDILFYTICYSTVMYCSLVRPSSERGGGARPRFCKDEEVERITPRCPVQLQRPVFVR